MAGACNQTPIFGGVIRGMLPLFVLTMLESGKLCGAELMAAFSRMSGAAWQPSPGSVYPLLRRLEADGLIAGSWRSGRAAPRRIYAITRAGRRELPRIRRQLVHELQRARTLIETHLEALQRVEAGEDARAVLRGGHGAADDA